MRRLPAHFLFRMSAECRDDGPASPQTRRRSAAHQFRAGNSSRSRALMALNALAIDIMLPGLQQIGASLGVENENHGSM